jgi:hypothetical protein
MDVGHITISLLRFRQDSIGLQRLSLEEIITHQLTFGALLAQYLKWSQEISCLSQRREVTTIRMKTIWLR